MRPGPRRPWETLYARVGSSQVRALQSFRATHRPQVVEVDGARWEVLVVGEGSRAVVFLHGMTGAYDIWWQQVERFQGMVRVVSVTYPPVRGLRGLEKGLLSVLTRAGIGPAVLVGTSLGGYLAQFLATRHPSRWEGVVLGNTFPPNDRIAAKTRLLGAALRYLPEWLVLAQFRRSFHRTIYPTSGRDELTLAFLNELSDGRMGKAQLVARYACVIEKFEAGPVGVPTLILESDNDPLVEPALREQLKATYPNAVVYTFRGAGHFPYLNRPEEYNRVLAAFLKGL